VRRVLIFSLALLIELPRPAAAAPLVSVGGQTFVSKTTRLWTEPNRFGEATAELKVGLPLEVLDYDASRSWVLIRTPSGREGWLPLRFTSQDSRRTQPMISHAPSDSDRKPAAAFEEAVAKDETAASPAPAGRPWEFALGYSNQVNHESAHGLSLDAGLLFSKESTTGFGAALGWKFHGKTTRGTCFTTDQCSVSRHSQRFYPHAYYRHSTGAFSMSAGLGLAIDRTSLTTKSLTTGQTYQVDDDGFRLTGSGTEFRLGFRVGARFNVLGDSPDMALGPYMDYDLDWALSNGAGEFAAAPVGRVFHILGGGVFLRKAF
jgi:hypothetical protein